MICVYLYLSSLCLQILVQNWNSPEICKLKGIVINLLESIFVNDFYGMKSKTLVPAQRTISPR